MSFKYESRDSVRMPQSPEAETLRRRKVTNPVLIRKFVMDFLAGTIQNPEYHRDKIIHEYIEAEKMYPKIFKNHDKAAAEIFKSLIV